MFHPTRHPGPCTAALAALALVLWTAPAAAAIPETTSFQGVLTDAGGAPLPDGAHDLHVRLYDGPDAGATLLWEEQQSITTTQGRFDVILGSVTPLALPFDATYWISTEVDGQGEMAPRVQLTGSPYALTARTVEPGGAVLSLNGLSDDVTLTGNGGITVDEVGNSIVIDGAGGQGGDSDWLIDGEDMYAIPGGDIGIGTDAPEGDVHIWDDNYATSLVVEDATPDAGFHDALLRLKTPYGYAKIEYFTTPEPTLNIAGSADNPMNVAFYTRSLEFNSNEDISFAPDAGERRVVVNSGGGLDLYKPDGTTRAANLFSSAGGRLTLYRNSDGGESLTLDGVGNYGGRVFGHDSDDVEVFTLRSQRGAGGGGGAQFWLRNDSGNTAIYMEGQEGGNAGQGGQISIHNDTGLSTIIMDGDHGSSDAGTIEIRDGAGNVNVRIQGDSNGQGRITTDVLEITAGADLSERFGIRGTQGAETPQPGMVVCIDPQRPGELTLAARAYDTRVAGVISGAGGIQPGMLMGQEASVADGDRPVALTGRVYVRADATHGTIAPGDLLTTSDTPGYAMKASDPDRRSGAILGKAMTGLDEGQGLVLALVALQ